MFGLPASQGKTDPAVIWDLVLGGYEGRFGVRWSVGAYNLFDWRYFHPVSQEFRQRTFVQAGRTLLVSANVTFWGAA